GQHDDIASTVAQARLAGSEISFASESLGPIMHQVKAAVADLLPVRDAALQQHEARHTQLAAAARNTTQILQGAEEDAVRG
ncbi:type VII secretion target, partial [Klebsiella pneumoniae]|nr:type VII secretion target [Klebsiella pneumoniae]